MTHTCTEYVKHAVRINQHVAGWDDAGCYVLVTIEPGANIPFYRMIEQGGPGAGNTYTICSDYCEYDRIAWLHGDAAGIPYAMGFQGEQGQQALSAALGSGRLLVTLAPDFRVEGVSFSYGAHIEIALDSPMLQYANLIGLRVAVSPH